MPMNSESHQKITAAHLSRTAYLYVRQSTLRQVLENTESTHRQYALRDRAVAMGWPLERVVVIDSDLGQSGASAADREGFQRLVTEVSLGRVTFNFSTMIVRAIARKPCAVAVSLSKPSRRSAVLTVFSLIGRAPPRIEGKTYFPCPESGRSSARIATAWLASGTRCGRPFCFSYRLRFISAAGIVQVGVSPSSSSADHCIARTLPGRWNSSAESFSAPRVSGLPW